MANPTQDFQTILYRQEGAVAYVTLNRPDKYNAINDLMGKELLAALRQCTRERSVRCVVISGAGGKAFSSGQDLKEVSLDAPGGFDYYAAVTKKYTPLVMALRQMPKPVIASVAGVAAGAGAALALACDIVIAGESAGFAQLFSGIGLVPDTGASYTLPRLVGQARAYELLATGRRVAAPEALSMGMIARVVPDGELEAATAALATDLAARPTATLGMIKQMLEQSLSLSLEQALEREAMMQQAAGQTRDHREGVEAFLQKRPPVFEGH